MSGRVGREYHSRRDHHTQQYHSQRHHNHHSSSSSRFDESKPSRGKNNPPSRHLWVGNLSHHISQSTLADHFIRFGDLENIACHSGRSYAFVNYVREDDAIAALNSLQGFSLAGMPLRIEFAKSDKSSAPPRDELYLQHRDELQPRNRSSAFSPRESRKRPASPDAYYPDSPRRNERGSDHPTEILWIGFPSCLKVDEAILRKAFSPFGDIDKITAFPGRTYAFVQFRNLASACRAKETLQGKLFGNPRVHISFSRKEHASSAGGRQSLGPNAPPSHSKSFNQIGSSDNLRADRNAREPEDPSIRVPHYPNMEYEDPEIRSFRRLESPWAHTGGSYEDRKFHELGPDIGPSQGRQEYSRSPFRDGSAQYHDFSPRNLRRKSPFPEDRRDLPEDTYNYHRGKKLKIDSFPREELPEYPLHNVSQDKHVFPGLVPEFSLSDESGPPIPYRRLPENPSNLNRSLGDRHDNWGSSHDTFRSPPPNSSSIPAEWKRTTSELHQRGTKEWKWEGTIAKGGTPVCQARCFPVGKVMDFFLPEFLDCTARTGLDMLSKHYYQATCSWVVFFVPASDADMVYYNEFMHYLGEKQRAAVAKLDDRNTLFLVPPSDFSENVLKIPGKLSISGVVLSLEPSSPTLASHPLENEMKNRDVIYSHADTSYSKLQFPGPSPIPSDVDRASLQGNSKASAPSPFPSYDHGSGSIPYHMESRHNFQPGYSAPRDATLQAYPVSEGYNNSNSGRGGTEFSRVIYDAGTEYSDGSKSSLHEQKFSSSVPSLPLSGFQQEQHADVSLRGQLQRQTTNRSPPAADVYRSSGFIGNQHESLSRVPPRYNASQTANQVSSDMSPSPFSQLQQQPVQAENVRAFAHAGPVATQGNQEIVNTGNAQDDGEADPQKRLQATLQLAAALLQQIQQGKAP
ncbi:flowering time control protein FPA-like isoform X2 [Chenopodium quinoa]|uniref:flowering time control protein FPA-like isoform X2 n=1 Tax=Chenopodium quinoa TaxID=63459 RepID=UPI000B79AAB1|nr:flowering time control protein FPA-like isoform X2 [Chenopodium quinoa]